MGIRGLNFTSISIIFFLVLLTFSCARNSEILPELPSQGICAHRGAMNTHPENTIAAFKEAVRLGAQMIEFDVRLTKDSALVVMHDESVDRTTNGSGFVYELTLSEIRKLDAGSWKSNTFTGEKVPTLKETLEMMPRNIWLNIHLKGDKKLGTETAKLVISENRKHQSIIAGENEAAYGVKEVDPEIYLCNMERLSSRSTYVSTTQKLGYPFIQLKKSRNDSLLKKDIQFLKRNGIRINYVQTNEVQEIGELLDLGIDFIFTDDLKPMVQGFETYGLQQEENNNLQSMK